MGRSIVPVVGRILEGEEWENADDGTRDDDVAIVAAGVAFVGTGEAGTMSLKIPERTAPRSNTANRIFLAIETDFTAPIAATECSGDIVQSHDTKYKMHANTSFISGVSFCVDLSLAGTSVMFTATPPVCEISFSFRLALFVLLFVGGIPALLEPPLAIEESHDDDDEMLLLKVPLLVVAIAKISKIEDHILGIGDIFFGLFEGDSDESSFLSPSSATPSMLPPCQRIDLVFRLDNNVTRSIAASIALEW